MVYGILPRKTEVIYTKFLNELKKRVVLMPKTINSDFEVSFINACLKVFPSVLIYLCFFHFKQSMWRIIQELGLATIYMHDAKIRKLLKLPQVLAYIPSDDVIEVFDKLKADLSNQTEDERVHAFYDYFEKNYVGTLQEKTTGRGKNKKTIITRANPRYAIKMWSVFTRINDCLSRTNNFTEAWHNCFSAILASHPGFYSLVDSLRSEQKLTEDKLIRLKTGIIYKRKPKYILLDERLQNTIKTYVKEKFYDFYENLQLILEY